MRSSLFIIAFALLSGCLTAPKQSAVQPAEIHQPVASADPIEQLVAELSATHGMWENGDFPVLDLPQTASPEDVIKKRFSMGLLIREAAHYQILKIRQIHIPIAEIGSDLYTAVVVRLDSGDKIVLIKYCGPKIGWWSRVYDIKPSA